MQLYDVSFVENRSEFGSTYILNFTTCVHFILLLPSHGSLNAFFNDTGQSVTRIYLPHDPCEDCKYVLVVGWFGPRNLEVITIRGYSIFYVNTGCV